MIRRLALGFGPACTLVLLLFFYRSALFQGGQYGYRDAAHFYYPLHQQVQAEWRAGRLPLWDPHENAGMPLLGNPTAAVLYPGKLVYAIFSFPWATRLYAVAHSALAFAGMWALLRRWGTSSAAATLAGLSFTFGAPVIFQTCNIIYLVGAAWTPWGFWAVDGWLRLRRAGSLPTLAVILAMQVLGGDPESAYVVGVSAGGYAFLLARDAARPAGSTTPRRSGRRILVALALLVVALALYVALWVGLGAVLPGLRPAPGEAAWGPLLRWWHSGVLPRFVPNDKPVPSLPGVGWLPRLAALGWLGLGLVLLLRWRRMGSRRVPVVPMLAGLAGSAILAGALAAAQLLPVIEFTGISVRVTDEGPHEIYPFSLEPYRVIELAWPGVFGRTFGSSVSWMGQVLPVIDHRVWAPSLYLGGSTLILAVAALGGVRSTRAATGERPSGGTRRDPAATWLVGVTVVALLASFGLFLSPIWLARFVPAVAEWIGPHDDFRTHTVRLDGYLSDGVGSPYGVLAGVLPGFGSFRFPSKLFTFVALGLASLAGLGWDRVVAGDGRRAGRLAVLGAGVSVLAALGFAAARGPIRAEFDSWQLKSTFGPLDSGEAATDLLLAAGQGALVLGGIALTIRLARTRPDRAGMLAVALMAFDLGWANHSQIQTVPQADFEVKPWVLEWIAAAERADPTPGPYRIHRMPSWSLPRWVDQASPERVRELQNWERATIQPKYGLPLGVDYTYTVGVAQLYDYEWFFAPFARSTIPEAARSLKITPGDKVVVYPRRGFDLWNSRYFIMPGLTRWDDPDRGIAAFLPETNRIYPPPDAFRGSAGASAQGRWAKTEDVQIFRNRSMYPRSWVVHAARFKPPVVGLGRDTRKETMEEILFPNDLFWQNPAQPLFDPHRLAWLETDQPEQLRHFVPGMDPTGRESVAVVSHEPTRVVLDAQLDFPGLVVLADVFYPGWELTIDGQPAPIHRANRLMRGAAVEAGRHRLVYTYNPASARHGALVSLAGLVVLLAGTLAVALRSRRRPSH